MARAPQVQRRDVPIRTMTTVVGSGGANHRLVAQSFAGITNQLNKLSAVQEQKQYETDIRTAQKEGRTKGFKGDAGALELRDGDTAADRAYNSAITRSYMTRLESTARTGLDALAQEHSHDPAVLQEKLAAYSGGFKSKLPVELQGEMQVMMDGLTRPYVSAARRSHEKNVLASDRADLLQQSQTRVTDIERIAYFGELDSETDAAVAAQVTGLENLLVQHGPKSAFTLGGVKYEADAGRSGALDPSSIVKYVDDAKSNIGVARIKGAFSRLDGGGAQARFIADIEGQFKAQKGYGGALSPKEFYSLRATFSRQLRANQTAQRAQVVDARRQIKDLKSVISKGFNPGKDALAGVSVLALASGDPQVRADYDNLVKTKNLIERARVQTPQELSIWIDARRDAIRSGASSEDVDLVLAVEKIRGEMMTGLKKDPIEWAARQGLVDIAPIDLDGENLPAQLAQRRTQAKAIADYYNTAPRFFTKTEVQELTLRSDQGGASLLAAANTVTAGFGDDALLALSEISKDAPVLAHLGGMVQFGGDPRYLQDAAAGIELRGSDGFESRLPKPAVRKQVQMDVFGTAFAALPRSKDAALKAAMAVYEARALNAGVIGGEDAGEEDSQLLERILQESVGATFEGKKQFGGIADVQDRQVIAPSWLRADKFDDVVAKFADTDWDAVGAYGPPIDADGVAISAKSLKNAYLVSVGKDRYRVSLTDPMDGAQYVAAKGAEDGLYILDMSRIATRMRFDGRFKKWVIDAVADPPRAPAKKRPSWAEQMQAGYALANKNNQGDRE